MTLNSMISKEIGIHDFPDIDFSSIYPVWQFCCAHQVSKEKPKTIPRKCFFFMCNYSLPKHVLMTST